MIHQGCIKKTRMPRITLTVRIHNANKFSQCDYYEMTEQELRTKCCIYSDGQIVFYNSLTPAQKDDCWKGYVEPYDIYNYECYNWWECDNKTRAIIELSKMLKQKIQSKSELH